MNIIAIGVPASIGIARGKARFIKSDKDFKKIKKGDIIISLIEHPLLNISVMKCSGIITNHGGITCHLAIIAREFKIPCIVGIKIPNILKDGDDILIDGNKGKVYKQ